MESLQMPGEKTVEPRYFECLNIPVWNNIFGININFDCGVCGFSQSVRVPLRDCPVVKCKRCRVLNKISAITTAYAIYICGGSAK